MGPRMMHYLKVSPFILSVFLAVEKVTLPGLGLLAFGTLLMFIPVRCPACSKRVDYNFTRVFLNDWGYTICVPRRCSRCGNDLTKRN